MKNVAIKFCSVDEARKRARMYLEKESVTKTSIYGISEEIYNILNNLQYKIIDTSGAALEIDFKYDNDTNLTLFIPKIFIDFEEI